MEISDRELYAEHDRREKERDKAHQIVLGRLVQAIRSACGRGDQSCRYQIPTAIIMGLPYTLDHRSCTEYLLANLDRISPRLRGRALGGGVLYITWQRDGR